MLLLFKLHVMMLMYLYLLRLIMRPRGFILFELTINRLKVLQLDIHLNYANVTSWLINQSKVTTVTTVFASSVGISYNCDYGFLFDMVFKFKCNMDKSPLQHSL